MRLTAKGIGKRALQLFGLLLAVVALWVGVVVFPSPLFAYAASFGDYRVYSDEPIPADFALVIDDTVRRVEAMEHEPIDANQRVYLCNSQKRYAFFAFLTRKTPDSLAIGLSIANESFVSMTRVRRFAETNRGRLRHTRFEGNVAEVIAHEIAHFNSVRALGYRAHLALPVWKSEGWAEYQANLAAIRDDPSYDLAKRIDQLLDDGYWGAGSLARDLWEWQLLVEFLGEVKGYALADLGREEVTEDSARKQMMAWYRDRSK